MDLKILAILVIYSACVTAGHHYHGRRNSNKPEYKWIDLTYALNNDTVMYPGRKLLFGTEYEGEMPNGDW